MYNKGDNIQNRSRRPPSRPRSWSHTHTHTHTHTCKHFDITCTLKSQCRVVRNKEENARAYYNDERAG